MGIFVHYEGLKKKSKKGSSTDSDLLTSLVLVTAHFCIRNIFCRETVTLPCLWQSSILSHLSMSSSASRHENTPELENTNTPTLGLLCPLLAHVPCVGQKLQTRDGQKRRVHQIYERRNCLWLRIVGNVASGSWGYARQSVGGLGWRRSSWERRVWQKAELGEKKKKSQNIFQPEYLSFSAVHGQICFFSL